MYRMALEEIAQNGFEVAFYDIVTSMIARKYETKYNQKKGNQPFHHSHKT